jgi:hypothetical protein
VFTLSVVHLDALALRVRSAGRVVGLPVLGVLPEGRKQLLALGHVLWERGSDQGRREDVRSGLVWHHRMVADSPTNWALAWVHKAVTRVIWYTRNFWVLVSCPGAWPPQGLGERRPHV